MTRSKLREHVFKTLFQAEFYSNEEMPEQIAVYLEAFEPKSEEDTGILARMLEDEDNVVELMSEEERAYVEQKVTNILEKKADIDEAINSKSTGWKTVRMGKVELTILRLAVYEMLYDEEIPTGVAIDQAVELSKTFGGDQSPAFVNGVLAKLA